MQIYQRVNISNPYFNCEVLHIRPALFLGRIAGSKYRLCQDLYIPQTLWGTYGQGSFDSNEFDHQARQNLCTLLSCFH